MRFPALDGFRGLAAYLVIFGHFANYTGFASSIFSLGTGQIGVMMFFVLSGFLMGALYIRRDFNTENVMSFVQKRVARVVPLYLVVVLIAFALNSVGLRTYDVNNSNLIDHLLFIRGVHALWTVAVEIQFYAIFPLIWWMGKRFGSAIPIMFVISAMAMMNFRSPVPLLTTGHFFLSGLLVSLFIEHKPKGNLLFVISIGLLALMMPSLANLLSINAAPWRSVAAIIGFPAILASCINSPWADRVLGSTVLSFLGNISYSAYLLHMPILWLGLRFTPFIDGSLIGFAIFIALVTAVAWLSYRFVEQPAQTMLLNWFSQHQFWLNKPSNSRNCE